MEDETPTMRKLKQLVGQVHGERATIVCGCSDGFAALNELQTQRYDIIISDIRMPMMNGLELLSKAKQLHPHIKSALLTGYNEFEYARLALRIGADEYLSKPANIEELYHFMSVSIERLDEENLRLLRTHFELICRGICSSITTITNIWSSLRLMLIESHLLTTDILQEIAHSVCASNNGFIHIFPCRFTASSFFILYLDDDTLHNALVSQIQAHSVDSGVIAAYIVNIKPDELLPSLVENLANLFELTRHNADGVYLVSEDMLVGKGCGSSVIFNAISFMKLHYNEHIDMAMLSSSLSVSPAYFSTLFKQCTGISPVALLTKIRMEEAKRLLRSTPDVLIKSIADMVGYDDQHYFSKAFTRYEGVSPAEYRTVNDNVKMKEQGY